MVAYTVQIESNDRQAHRHRLQHLRTERIPQAGKQQRVVISILVPKLAPFKAATFPEYSASQITIRNHSMHEVWFYSIPRNSERDVSANFSESIQRQGQRFSREHPSRPKQPEGR